MSSESERPDLDQAFDSPSIPKSGGMSTRASASLGVVEEVDSDEDRSTIFGETENETKVKAEFDSFEKALDAEVSDVKNVVKSVFDSPSFNTNASIFESKSSVAEFDGTIEDLTKEDKILVARASVGRDLLSTPDQKTEPEVKGASSASSTSSMSSNLPKYMHNKKYRVTVVPSYEHSRRNICGRPVGRAGVSFCTLRGCEKTHKPMNDRIRLEPGQVFIAKSDEEAFISPSVNSSEVGDRIIGNWMKHSMSIGDWEKEFDAAKLAYETQKETATALDEEEKTHENNAKTEVKKESVISKELLKQMFDSMDFSVYVSNYKESMHDLDEMNSCLESLDQALMDNTSDHQKLYKTLSNLGQAFVNLEENVKDTYDTFSTQIGSKPHDLPEALDSGSLWDTMGNFSDMLSSMETVLEEKHESAFKDLGDKLKGRLDELESVVQRSHLAVDFEKLELNVKKAKQDIDKHLKMSTADLRADLSEDLRTLKRKHGKLNEYVSALVSKTAEKLAEVRGKLIFVAKEVQDLQGDRCSAGFNTGSEQTQQDSQIPILLSKIEKIEKRIKGNGKSIKFQSFGFNGKPEADAWCETHIPDGKFGLILDFPALMEHVHQRITGIESLSRFEKLKKLNIESNHEGVFIMSYESRIPQFFDRSTKHTVYKSSDSMFSEIKSYDQWNEPTFGFKEKWKSELESIREAHTNAIHTAFNYAPQGNPYYTAALASVDSVIAFCYNFMQFIDNTYIKYSINKFGSNKAWHVTTKLATALMLEMSKPRESALNSLSPNNTLHNAKVVFWTTCLSIDVMNEITTKNFIDHPAVSNELLQFLSTNTTVEAVEVLKQQMSDVKENEKRLNLAVKGAGTKADTASDKVAKLEAVVKELRKELDTLKKKK